jgi:hypothetical protein
MIPEWEYCELVIYSALDELGIVRQHGFVTFEGIVTPKIFAKPTHALARLRQQGWQVTTVASNTHPDGTIQRNFYLKRSRRNTK